MSDSLIEEYKTLRDEIKRNEGEGLQILLFLITSIFTVFGFIKPPGIELWLLALILQAALIISLAQYLDSLRLRIRLSKYIQVFLESEPNDLHWETRHSHFIPKGGDSSLYNIVRLIYNLFLNIFSILFGGATIFSWYAFRVSYKNSESYYLFCLLFIVLLIFNFSNLCLTVMIIRNKYYNRDEKSYDKKCIEQWTSIKKSEERSSSKSNN